jgi:CheY-like chemotaxis protein
MKILIVEDDPKTAQAIHRGLGAEGYVAAVARNSPDGLARLAAGSFDAVVLASEKNQRIKTSAAPDISLQADRIVLPCRRSMRTEKPATVAPS